MWCASHECCSGCKTTARKHMARGLCARCYLTRYRKANGKRIAKLKRQWRDNHFAELTAKEKVKRDARHFDGKRELALKRANYSCERCGTQSMLTVHHRDRNGRGTASPNNSLRNLQVLCRACHLAEHRGEIMHIRLSSRQPQLLKCGRWSLQHACCVVCGSTCSKHAAKGVCSRCYQIHCKTR